jgi:hypothetical protein
MFEEQNEGQAGFEGKIIRMMRVDDMYSKMWDIFGILREVRRHDFPEIVALDRIEEVVNGVDFDADGWI